jgi:hypothetical protein
MEPKGIKRTYYITTELEDGIRTLAYLRKTTLSEIVRKAMKEYLAANKTYVESSNMALPIRQKEAYDVQKA